MESKKLLEQLGFTTKETEVYLTILKLGKSTPAKIAKVTKLNRPTIYNVAKSLISKGVISEDLTDKTLHLVALVPESLKSFLDRSRAELRKKEMLVDATINELKKVTAGKKYTVPTLRFIEEGELKDFLYHSVGKWQKTITGPDGSMYGFQDHSFVEHYQDWVEWTGEKFKGTRFNAKLFTNDSTIEQKMKGRVAIRHIRYLENAQFTSTTWVVGEYLIMIYTRESPFYLFEIHDKPLAQNMQEVFKRLWDTTKQQ